jgi:hypothetical protein
VKKLLFPAVLALLALALLPALGAGKSGPKTYLGGCASSGKAKFKPHKFVLACGDGSAIFKKAKWKSWGKHKAKGKGVLRLNNCTPSCAQGTFHNHKARIRLSKVLTCTTGRKHQFGRVVVRWGKTHKAEFTRICADN